MSKSKTSIYKSFALIAAALYFLVFLFSFLAANQKSTFLDAVKFKFTKTPTVLTFGERCIDFVQIAAPLLLAIALVTIFLLYSKFPTLSATAFLLAVMVVLSGITVFVCLNTYNIIETFNDLSKTPLYINNDSTYSTCLRTLLTLIPYHIFLIIYAGSISNLALNIKKRATGKPVKSGSFYAFSIANFLLGAWHLTTLFLPSPLVTNYFETQSVTKNPYTLCEIALVLCYFAVCIFSFLSARYFSKQSEPKNN